jgi:hypothetical protein
MKTLSRSEDDAGADAAAVKTVRGWSKDQEQDMKEKEAVPAEKRSEASSPTLLSQKEKWTEWKETAARTRQHSANLERNKPKISTGPRFCGWVTLQMEMVTVTTTSVLTNEIRLTKRRIILWQSAQAEADSLP